jgi:hypothetical protein
MVERFRTGIVLAGCLVLAAGCGGGDGSGGSGDTGGGGDGVDADASGVVQKGPFQPGGTALAVRLDTDGSRSGDSKSGDIGDRGGYELPELGWDGPTLVVLTGPYFDEIAGSFSSDDREIHAVAAASDGAVATNANLYTHLEAHRVRALMANGTDFAGARDQAADELGTLVGIETAAGELDLLEAGDGTEGDSANLLLFSAALLKAGHGQTAIDALAEDFADDGAINGGAADEWRAIQDEAEGDTLLQTARTRLQNQYGETPPEPGDSDEGDYGWRLSPCQALALSEPRVVCEGEPFYGNHRDDSGEFIPFVPDQSGHYTVELFGDPEASDDNTGLCSWTVYGDADVSATEYGDSGATNGFCGVEDVTNLRLTGGETYYIRPTVDQSDSDGPDARFKLSVSRTAEGRQLSEQAVELTVGETREATIGTLISTSDASYYRFSAGVDGTYIITATGYPCASGELRLNLYREGSNGFSSEVDHAWTSDVCTQTLEVDLEAGTYYLAVENWLSSLNRVNSRPAPAGIGFDLTVEKQ